MTYNDWRDELKNNLLCVSEAERRRVLDYYAEAYADRRDAGFSEREIIDDFGAPYDAAQRILSDCAEEQPANPPRKTLYGNAETGGGARYAEPRREPSEAAPPSAYAPQPAPRKRGDYTWVFVLLCVIFAIPIFVVVIGMVAVTISFVAAPFAFLVSGVASIGAGVGALFYDLTEGAMTIAAGLMIFGLSLIIMPLCFKLIKLMWKLFTMFFGGLKRIFSGKEKQQ